MQFDEKLGRNQVLPLLADEPALNHTLGGQSAEYIGYDVNGKMFNFAWWLG